MAKTRRTATVHGRCNLGHRLPGGVLNMLDIAFAKPTLPKSGALVLLVGEGEIASGIWRQADEATDGAIARALKAAEFKGAKGKSCTILAPGAGLSRVVT